MFGGKVRSECVDRNAPQPLLQRDTFESINAMAFIELLNGPNAPSFVAGTDNFYVITRYNWSSYGVSGKRWRRARERAALFDRIRLRL